MLQDQNSFEKILAGETRLTVRGTQKGEVFTIEQAILDDPDTKDVEEITLSYTFYPVDSGKTAS